MRLIRSFITQGFTYQLKLTELLQQECRKGDTTTQQAQKGVTAINISPEERNKDKLQ